MKKLLQTTGLIFAMLLLANVGMAQTYTFSPANEATGVSTSPMLTITFDDNVELVKGKTLYVVGSSWDDVYEFFTGTIRPPKQIDARLNVDGKTLTLDLTEENLIPNTTYSVFFDQGAIKVGTNIWDGLYDEGYEVSIWSFTTGAAPIIPIATSFTPANNSTGISINTSLSIDFDNNITLGSGNFKVKTGVTEVASFSTTDSEVSVVSGSQLAIDLSGLTLDYNTEYHIEMDAEFILNFVGFTGSSGWSFTTETAPINYTLTPANAAIEVSTSPTLIITFDDVVTLESGKGLYLKNESGDNVEQFSTGIVGWVPFDERLIISGNTLTIDLSNSVLSGNTNFFVAADEGVIKVGGVVWDELNDLNYVTSIWSFTTGASPVDPEAPIITSLTPPKDTTDVSVTPTLILEFDRVITKGSTGQFKIKFGSSDAGIYSTSSGQVSVSGNKLTVNATGLSYNTPYHVEIDPGFILDFDGISDSNYWRFTTETKPPQWAESYPTITQSLTGFTFTGKTDLAGIGYFVVTSFNNMPTAAQIKAGQNHLGNSARKFFNEAITGEEEFSTTMTFVPELLNQTYYIHALVSSGVGKNSEIKTLTIDRTAPEINNLLSNPIDGYQLFKLTDTLLVVFSEKVYDYNAGDVTPLSSASFTLKKGGVIIPVNNISVSPDGTEVTLIPVDPLTEDTEYVLEIKPLSDIHYNVMPNAVTRTFETDKLNMWGGTSSTSWTDPANWAELYAPGKSVIIQSSATNFPVIDVDITVNNLMIEAGAVVTHESGAITVLGDFDLLSSVDKNATYLPKGGTLTVIGETRVHQHIESVLGTTVVYVMGTPTLGATNDNVGTEYRIKKYDNPTDSWLKINSDLMEPGVGYSIYAENDLIFRGAINRVATRHDLKRTNGKGYGWNVMGNPFTAGMKWSKLDIPLTVENSYWIWTPQDKIYGAFNQEVDIGVGGLDGTIPSNHGFLVKLKIGETTGSITFDPKAMVVNKDNYLKSTSKSKPHMKISAGRGNSKDQLAIAFVSDATQGIDKYDTEKFFGSGTLEVFSVEGTSKLSINSLPDTNEETTVGLGYKASEAGTYTIELSDNYLDHYEVVLTDTKKGTSVDLLHDGSYTFTVDGKETNTSRFTLTFPARIPTSVNKEVSSIGNMKIYLKDGDVMVQIIDATESMTYELVGISGNMIGRGSLHSGVNNLGKFPSGLYIINTRNGEGTILSKKLLVTR